MLVEAAEFRDRVLEFIVFFLATALVWGEIDLCRFLIFGRKPMVDRFIWVFSWYSLVWIIAICASNFDRIRKALEEPSIESLQLSVEQDSSS